jgi:hypothetical protein
MVEQIEFTEIGIGKAKLISRKIEDIGLGEAVAKAAENLARENALANLRRRAQNGEIVAVGTAKDGYCPDCDRETTHLKDTRDNVYYCVICRATNYTAQALDDPEGFARSQKEIAERIAKTGCAF